MSFSSDVKGELSKQFSKSRHCQLAELAAMISLNGKINTQTFEIELITDNVLLLQKYALLMKQAFSVDISKPLLKEDEKRVLDAIKWEPGKGDHFRTDGLLVQKDCCKRAFIRGAFLSAGSISDPTKSYHFEIVCEREEQALQLKELMQDFECDAKIVERKGHFVVYLKEGAQIVDILNVMEAYVSLMNLENVRILKEMRNSLNRQVNCETANIKKTVSAAVKQIDDITLIRDTIGFGALPEHLRQMAELRLEYPDTPLKELGTLMDPPVGKSGVNHRLRKLSEIAEKCKNGIGGRS
ncbi:MAG: DNA-binding protein WhiA [Agathobacter sp.]